MSVLNVGSKFGKGSFEKLSGTGISIPSLPRHRRRDRKCFARDLVSRYLGPPVHRFWWDTGTFKGDFTCAKQYAGKSKVLSWSMSLKQVMTIAHFTVVCLVARPRNSSKAGGDFSLIQTSLLFTFKWKQLAERQLDLQKKNSEVLIKKRPRRASLPFKGQVSKETTVKWSINILLQNSCFKTLVLHVRDKLLQSKTVSSTLLGIRYSSASQDRYLHLLLFCPNSNQVFSRSLKLYTEEFNIMIWNVNHLYLNISSQNLSWSEWKYLSALCWFGLWSENLDTAMTGQLSDWLYSSRQELNQN